MAFANVPMAEFLVMSEDADECVPNFGTMFVEEPLPINGYISLPASKPGWGLEFNYAALALKRPFPHSPVPRPLMEARHPTSQQSKL